jgi:hypothetical protein
MKKSYFIIGIFLLLLLVSTACERETRRLDDLVDWDKGSLWQQNLESKIDEWVANKDCDNLEMTRDAAGASAFGAFDDFRSKREIEWPKGGISLLTKERIEVDEGLWYYINFLMWELKCPYAGDPAIGKFDIVR